MLYNKKFLVRASRKFPLSAVQSKERIYLQLTLKIRHAINSRVTWHLSISMYREFRSERNDSHRTGDRWQNLRFYTQNCFCQWNVVRTPENRTKNERRQTTFSEHTWANDFMHTTALFFTLNNYFVQEVWHVVDYYWSVTETLMPEFDIAGINSV